jgi:hypothetical protein
VHDVELFETTAAVGAAVASSLIHDPGADAGFVDAIVRTRTEQHWGHLWRVFGSAATHLARHGRYEPAGVIYGHLRHHYRWNLFPGDRPVEVLGGVDDATAAAWTARGAAMTVDELVAFTLHTLRASTGNAVQHRWTGPSRGRLER